MARTSGSIRAAGCWAFSNSNPSKRGSFQLAPGDRILLYTDGVTEARDGAGIEFGDSRLIEVLQDCRDADPQIAQEKIFSTVEQFCGGNWEDDATLIVLSVE